jgi:hypothetical protein
MNTIYWLSVFGMVVCYGMFIRSLALAFVAHKFRARLPPMAQLGLIMSGGPKALINYKWEALGVISTIVFATI